MKKIFTFLIIAVTILISINLIGDQSSNKVKLNNKIKLSEELVIGKEEHKGQFLFDPIDVKVHKEHIYILDYRDCCVKKFDINGNFIISFGKKGQGPGELNHPSSFFIRNKKIYIANSRNGRIEIFNLNGLYNGSFRTPNVPREIGGDDEGNLFINYIYNNFLVHKYKEDGQLIKSFIPSSNEKDPLLKGFYNQLEMSVTNKNELFVGYKYLNKIEKYDSEGNIIFTVARPLAFNYEPLKPIFKGEEKIVSAAALTVDISFKEGILYVLTSVDSKDITKNICDRINNKGKYLDSFNINIPAISLSFDINHNIYIINFMESTIHKFNISL